MSLRCTFQECRQHREGEGKMAEADFSAGCADAPGDVKGPGPVRKAGKEFSGPGVVAARRETRVLRAKPRSSSASEKAMEVDGKTMASSTPKDQRFFGAH
ncbi:hypothetical protein HPB52_022976 [Rhipicephalus sanguineus]|uniref:Uncharacterized protein n=1 Tax=Rhipicephalus sanguineus TaxID=34632 RepID=A0A9D4SRN3_RHISA|nr:hypothetical protein HPB52_022976 [Rhipicephalus sanguineus]